MQFQFVNKNYFDFNSPFINDNLKRFSDDFGKALINKVDKNLGY